MGSGKMKVGVWVLSDYKPRIGGGFSLYEKFIQLIDEHAFSDELEVCFVGHRPAADFSFRKEYVCLDFVSHVISGGAVKKGLSNALVAPLSRLVSIASHKLPFVGRVERKILSREGVDLIFYPVQGFKKVIDFPFISANWDIGHKASFAFPEISMHRKFEYRDKWYARDIFKALMVLAESEAGKEELVRYTGINPERIDIVPLFPGGVVDLAADEIYQQNVLKKMGLAAQNYFFYPAQFWAHKNHFNLIRAFAGLRGNSPEVKLVFTGSDKGNKNYIMEVVEKEGLGGQVLFTGFIENKELFTLYRNAIAMVMPTFYGPTNMPLIEARELDCPVLCSDLPGHREIMDDGALYFDPKDAGQILNAMQWVLEPGNRIELIQKAGRSRAESVFSSSKAITALEKCLLKVKPVRQTWGANHKIF